MDLTHAEADDQTTKAVKRSRNRYYDEEQEDNIEDWKDEDKKEPEVQPANKMSMTVRYTLFWTEVKDKELVKTHSVEVDVEAHTLVFEVLESALKALRLLLGQRASQTLLQMPASNWELRFCKSDGYPLFDIPCSIMVNDSY